MNLKLHIGQYLDVYLILTSWALVGAVAPSVVAMLWSCLTFLLILRTRDFSKVLLSLLTMLVFSDSRMNMFDFAENAKVLVVIVLFISVVLEFRHYRQYSNKIFKYLLPFLVFSILATFWSVETLPAFQKSVSYALVCFTIPLVFLRAIDENEQFGGDFIFFILLILGIGLFFYGISPGRMTLMGRFHGLLGNPNGLGIFQAISFPLCYLFWLNFRDRFSSPRIVWLFLAVFAVSLILTGSRTSIFSIFIFILFSRLRYFSNWATVLGFLTMVIGFEFIMMQLPMIIKSLGLQEFFRLDTLQKGSGRDVAWIFARQQIEKVYYTGGGFGYTEYIYRMNYNYLSMLGHQGNAHNSYLTLWLDTGIIGLSLFIFGLLRIVIDSVKSSSYTLPAVFAVLFSSYYESWLAASLNPFTSMFFIMLVLLSLKSTAVMRETDGGKPNKESQDEPKLMLGNA